MNENQRVPTSYAPATVKAMKFLREQPVGSIFSHDQMTEVMGKDSRSSAAGGGRSNLDSAIRNLWRNEGIVYKWIRGVGLKRLNDPEIAIYTHERLRSENRHSRKSLAIGTVADVSKLEEDDREQHLITMAQLNLTHHMGSSYRRKRLAEVGLTPAIDVPKLLEAMNK